MMSFFMKDQALIRYKWMVHNKQLTTWPAFEHALEMRFGPSSYDNHRATLFKLRQTGSVEEFQTQFETLCNRVNGLLSDAILDCFFVRIKANNP